MSARRTSPPPPRPPNPATGSHAARAATRAAVEAYDAESARLLAAVEAYDAESARLLTERRAGYARLYAAYEQLGLTWRAAVDAARELNRLRAAHPDLLAHEPPASKRDCE